MTPGTFVDSKQRRLGSIQSCRGNTTIAISDRPGVTMHPAQPDMDFLTN